MEIAVFPPDATVDTFDWRISMATVAEDGPFSVFDGVERTLSILEGAGMELSVEGRETVTLTQTSVPYPFPADAPTSARLVDGTITDLNVMTRRGRFSHVVEAVKAPLTTHPATGTTLVLCHRDEMRISTDTSQDMLASLDCAVLDAGQTLDISGHGEGFMIRLW